MSKFKESFSLFFRGTDKILTLLCLLASTFGIVMVYSATRHTVEGGGFPRDALTMIFAVIIGLAIAFGMSLIDYDAYCRIWWVWGALGVFLMILVMLVGVAPSARQDARTWLNLGIIYFQPSELVKVFFITTFSVHLYSVRDEINKVRNVLLLVLHALIPFALVSISGDDGSALVFLLIALSMIIVAGLSWKYILGFFALVGAAIPLVWSKLTNFQKERFVVIWNPDKYPGTSYQQNLGLAALYNGGVLGKGLFKGNYTQNGVVPESQNDMIFTVIGEELGVIGGLVAILLLMGIILRIIKIGRSSVDGPAQYACYGIASMIGFQTLINLAMVFRIGPVIGITLPFFSAGGSSTLCLYVAIGLVLSIQRAVYSETADNMLPLIGVTSRFDPSYRSSEHQKKPKRNWSPRARKAWHQAKRMDRKANSILPNTRRGHLQYDFDHKNRKSPPSHATFKPRAGSKKQPRYRDENK